MQDPVAADEQSTRTGDPQKFQFQYSVHGHLPLVDTGHKNPEYELAISGTTFFPEHPSTKKENKVAE